jgi:hypothetical protein
MDQLPEFVQILLGVAALAAAIIVLPAIAQYYIIRLLSNPKLHLKPADGRKFSRQIRDAQKQDEWAREHGFEHLGCYVLSATPGILIAAWRHTSEPTFMAMYYQQLRPFRDLVTMFQPDASLTTGSSADGLLMPRPPTDYSQCFTGLDADRLWERHREAIHFLTTRGRVSLARMPVDFERSFVTAMHDQCAHVRTIPLWPFRAIFWYFGRRRRLRNVSVEEQHQRGWVQLPWEAPLIR